MKLIWVSKGSTISSRQRLIVLIKWWVKHKQSGAARFGNKGKTVVGSWIVDCGLRPCRLAEARFPSITDHRRRMRCLRNSIVLAFLDYLTPAGGIPRQHHHQAIRGVINDIIARNRQLSNATFTVVHLPGTFKFAFGGYGFAPRRRNINLCILMDSFFLHVLCQSWFAALHRLFRSYAKYIWIVIPVFYCPQSLLWKGWR